MIKSPADAKGLKLRASNRQTNDAFTLLGAQTQSIPPPGVPEALAKGVLDGVVFPYDAVIPFKLDELTNRVSEFGGDRNFYNSVMLFVMNKAKYDSLPDDLKKIIDANSGAALAADLGRKWDEWDQIGRAAVVKRSTPIHVIDGADLAAWKKAVEPLYASWIAERDKAGDNGAELLKAAQELIAKHSQVSDRAPHSGPGARQAGARHRTRRWACGWSGSATAVAMLGACLLVGIVRYRARR